MDQIRNPADEKILAPTPLRFLLYKSLWRLAAPGPGQRRILWVPVFDFDDRFVTPSFRHSCRSKTTFCSGESILGDQALEFRQCRSRFPLASCFSLLFQAFDLFTLVAIATFPSTYPLSGYIAQRGRRSPYIAVSPPRSPKCTREAYSHATQPDSALFYAPHVSRHRRRGAVPRRPAAHLLHPTGRATTCWGKPASLRHRSLPTL